MRKFTLYAIIIAAVGFLYWFLPKYTLIRENPGYCAQLTEHLFYCGSQAGLGEVFSGPRR